MDGFRRGLRWIGSDNEDFGQENARVHARYGNRVTGARGTFVHDRSSAVTATSATELRAGYTLRKKRMCGLAWVCE